MTQREASREILAACGSVRRLALYLRVARKETTLADLMEDDVSHIEGAMTAFVPRGGLTDDERCADLEAKMAANVS